MTLRKVGTWHEAVARGTAATPRRDGDGTDADRGHACDDRHGVICPLLADARAEAALAERQLLEFNHRLANVLQAVLALLVRQGGAELNRAVRQELDRMAMRVGAVAALHRHLFAPSREARVDLGATLRELAVAIEGVTGLVCDLDLESVSVPGRAATHLATAVNELAWNAHKHAYPGAVGLPLQIACRRDADGRLLISVADWGRGLPAGFDPGTASGFGLTIVRATARTFGGELRIESNGGARFTLLLPMPHA